MSFLLRLIVIVGVLWFILQATGMFKSHSPRQKKPPIKQSEQVREELEHSVDQYQQKLDQAMQQSGAGQ